MTPWMIASHIKWNNIAQWPKSVVAQAFEKNRIIGYQNFLLSENIHHFYFTYFLISNKMPFHFPSYIPKATENKQNRSILHGSLCLSMNWQLIVIIPSVYTPLVYPSIHSFTHSFWTNANFMMKQQNVPPLFRFAGRRVTWEGSTQFSIHFFSIQWHQAVGELPGPIRSGHTVISHVAMLQRKKLGLITICDTNSLQSTGWVMNGRGWRIMRSENFHD